MLILGPFLLPCGIGINNAIHKPPPKIKSRVRRTSHQFKIEHSTPKNPNSQNEIAPKMHGILNRPKKSHENMRPIR
ncbi:hypothetical protein EYC80_003929 [Monilinia laxa]|uniref:Uncharacterized protein n=1 Tax=Monilinia laxa TaxID=61186 RepID=A0A5N6KLI2_MONLA|nr:hypothetical protein EYC80_003929 [Monilinia laxa]